VTLPGFEPGKYPFRAVGRDPTAWFWTGVSAARGDAIAPVAASRGPAEGVASGPGAGTRPIILSKAVSGKGVE